VDPYHPRAGEIPHGAAAHGDTLSACLKSPYFWAIFGWKNAQFCFFLELPALSEAEA